MPHEHVVPVPGLAAPSGSIAGPHPEDHVTRRPGSAVKPGLAVEPKKPRRRARARLIALGLALFVTGSLAAIATSHAAISSPDIRAQAAAWVAEQVSPDVTVSCDAVMCAALLNHGFPAGELVVLGPATPDPVPSAVVVETPAVRGLFGSSLAITWAPAVLASFGSGRPHPGPVRAATGALQSNKTKEAAMAGESQFTIGARASCTDGHCGEVRRLIIDPATETVTHLVIQPGHRQEAGRLVPVRLVETADGEIRLRCTRAEFDELDHAAERDMVAGAESSEIVGRQGMTTGTLREATVLEDVIPVGEKEVGPGEPVHALDGEIGRVQGFLVNPGDDRVTHVLLLEGHLWGRKKVAIPISAVTGIDAGIRLNLTKQQIGELPPVA